MKIDYNKARAETYWSNRVESTKNQLNAVGYLSKDLIINEEYTNWEKSVLKNILTSIRVSKAMDLGCGVGRLSSVLVDIVDLESLYLVDLSKNMLEKCKDNLSKYKTPHKDVMHFLNNSSDKIEIANESVDFIMCMGIFEHLPLELQRKTIREISRILMPGGVLTLEINNSNSIFLKESTNKDRYRIGSQFENGYFCGVVNVNNILKEIQQHNLNIIKHYANTNFSILLNFYDEYIDDKQKKPFMSGVHNHDLSERKDIMNKHADQLILVMEKNTI